MRERSEPTWAPGAAACSCWATASSADVAAGSRTGSGAGDSDEATDLLEGLATGRDLLGCARQQGRPLLRSPGPRRADRRREPLGEVVPVQPDQLQAGAEHPGQAQELVVVVRR